MKVGDAAPDETLADHEGRRVALSHLWSERPLWLLFVRHLGCPFCREHLGDVGERYREVVDAGGEVAAVTMGTVEQVAAFREQFRLPFRCFADATQAAYRAFDVPRVGWMGVAGPAVWAPGLRAVRKGGLGKPVGDVRQLHGEFVIDRHGVVRLALLPKHSAEHADIDSVLNLLRTLTAAPATD